jgi:hypothetical protein
VTISLTNVTVPVSFVSILKPDGTQLVSNQLVGAFPKTIQATPNVDGTYTIVIDPQGTATGSMTIGVS